MAGRKKGLQRTQNWMKEIPKNLSQLYSRISRTWQRDLST